jgi:hypothetical protein
VWTATGGPLANARSTRDKKAKIKSADNCCYNVLESADNSCAYFIRRLSTQHESTLDILFSKLKETKAVHITMGLGTNFEVKIPWKIDREGYTSNISGTLMMAEATTSLSYRDMLKCETLQIQVQLRFLLKV